MRLIEAKRLDELVGVQRDTRRICDLGVAVLDHGYSPSLLQRIGDRALELRQAGERRFLGLEHLRQAHVEIPEIEMLMRDEMRLSALSDVAGVELEPYPLTTAASHINFYSADTLPIALHTDGAAMVELIPLIATGRDDSGATLIYRGPPEEGEVVLQDGASLPSEKFERVPQKVGCSVLLQGRMLLHGADTVRGGQRITLVLVLRSAVEPWKDDNTLMRLMLDDDLDQIQDEWIKDIEQHKLPAFREMLDRRSPA